MRRYIVLFAALYLLGACGGEPTPTPDLVATQIAVEKAAHATMTAEAPTPTSTPTHTATPVPTSTPTTAPTSTPTHTPTSTSTPTTTPTNIPTDTPTATHTPSPTKKPAPQPTNTAVPALSITYQDFHYECRMRTFYSRSLDEYIWGYRSFQTLAIITNNSKETLEPPWDPSRWIIADGEERVDTMTWEWVSRTGDFYEKPPITPGATVRWTFVVFPVERWEWVKAVEFEALGETYRFEFPKPSYEGEFNYTDCGDYPDSYKP